MTDNEIIKALEHIIKCNEKQIANCTGCPLEKSYPHCDDLIESMCLDLIKRQQAEIEEVTYKLECLLDYTTCGKLSKASYSLLTMEQAVTNYINELFDDAVKEIKIEAIKEFARRLKGVAVSVVWDGKYHYEVVSPGDIDNLVEEMTEGV